jgi:hypothetical protein
MLSNEQRYALATKMMSIVERMIFVGERVQTLASEPTEPAKREADLSNRLDDALSEFAKAAFQEGPESLLPEEVDQLFEADAFADEGEVN